MCVENCPRALMVEEGRNRGRPEMRYIIAPHFQHRAALEVAKAILGADTPIGVIKDQEQLRGLTFRSGVVLSLRPGMECGLAQSRLEEYAAERGAWVFALHDGPTRAQAQSAMLRQTANRPVSDLLPVEG